MEPLTMLALASTVAQGLAQVNKSLKNARNEKKAKQYEGQMEEFAKKQQEEEERDKRRAALARAVGATDTFLGSEKQEAPEAPKLENTTAEDVISGISNVVGSTASGVQNLTAPKPAALPAGTIRTDRLDVKSDPLAAVTGTKNKYNRYITNNNLG
jgi:hypothetical protein